MSLVGNVAINNYDREDAAVGAGTGYPARTPPAHSTNEQGDSPERSVGSSTLPDEKGHDASDAVSRDGPNSTLKRTLSNQEEMDMMEEARREEEVHSLAKELTRRSSMQSTHDGRNPFTDFGSSVDPSSPHFKARSWAKAMLGLRSRDPEKHPQRTAGFAFRNLSVHGYGDATDYQKSVGNVWFEVLGIGRRLLGIKQRKIDILRDFEGVVEAGEMLVVLGPPGSGCSTLLKTIAGETDGIYVDSKSHLNYQGISAKQMHSHFRGEAIYTAEVDVHFPMLSVADTLSFAARARAPRDTFGVNKWTYSNHMRDVVMAMFGITHTLNTRVGNDFVRGVSGGERKRVSIAEAALVGAPLQCWDNSTRGLDSANAIEFCKTLRMETDILGNTAAVAIYQSPQSAYDCFDKAVVLYEGHQIYFGRTDTARKYFEDMGFWCPDRQTTADFLTSMTSAQERVPRDGFEDQVPRTPAEFAQRWRESAERARLVEQLEAYEENYPIGGEYLEKFKRSRRAQQSKNQRVSSPYTLSYIGQINLCLWRGFQRLKGDPTVTVTQLFSNAIMALVIGSVFYNLQDDTNSFYQRGALLFFAILMNAFGSALEILTLYAQRPIVEKQSRYAMYHPSAEAIASSLTDMPYKILNSIGFNLVLYFMTNLRREPGAFFFFLLITFFLTLVMSNLFRTIASVSRTLSQALAPAAILILAIVIYTGFTIPTTYMLGWSRWINYLDPVAYGFEALMINEFHDRNFDCSLYVPMGGRYDTEGKFNRACSAVGSKPGQSFVNGDTYINSSFAYYHAHKWRNFGIMIVFLIGFFVFYIASAEYISAKKSKGEVLVFRRGQAPAALTKKNPDDVESGVGPSNALEISQKNKARYSSIIQKQTSIFHWKDVCYDIKIKGEPRRILDQVDGWVTPGKLTALMGVSGAGKTTLLDCLATRVTMGVISGEMLVDGRQRDDSFQRKTGYVQQQDLHLSTSTVREALNFSAILRQPASVSKEEKLKYVDEVIKILDMEEYADAVVGVPGEGLNVEQRKRLTIGVELAAKPQLLLFLDEPTSGLDSQTSWAILDLLENLKNNGQAILCTIHQPSAMLFQRFDRLLFLKSGGQTVYFGDIGEGSHKLISYFEKNGAPPCPPEANPAEWMLEAIGAAPGSVTDIDWFDTWRNSPEFEGVHTELERLKAERPKEAAPAIDPNDKASYREFAAPFGIQLLEVLKRVFEQYWRTPSYIYSKLSLVLFSGLFIGFSFFKATNTMQGLQNQMFAMFMLMTIFSQLCQQIMPHFVMQRSLYEVRERPSKAYSWKAFMIANIFVELPWNSLAAMVLFFTWYYPIGLYMNAEPTDAVTERGGLMFLYILTFLLFASTFADMAIAAIPDAETGGNIANLIFSLSLIFCGVLASPSALPGFWIFMYRVSPFTYLISGMLATAVSGTKVICATNEYLHFEPPNGQTCAKYMDLYINGIGSIPGAGGYLENPQATSNCSFCSISSTDTFLASVSSYWDNAWRNFGIMWAYIIFNVVAAVFFYWLARVPKGKKQAKEKSE